MSDKNKESLLWQKVKKGLVNCFLTRIESSIINGIPNIHGVHKSGVFWIELKSDEAKYPKQVDIDRNSARKQHYRPMVTDEFCKSGIVGLGIIF